MGLMSADVRSCRYSRKGAVVGLQRDYQASFGKQEKSWSSRIRFVPLVIGRVQHRRLSHIHRLAPTHRKLRRFHEILQRAELHT